MELWPSIVISLRQKTHDARKDIKNKAKNAEKNSEAAKKNIG